MDDGRRLLVGCIIDISDFRQAEALIWHLAEHDALTGLPNRRRLAEKVKEAVASSQLSGTSYSVLLIDLDRFKPVNDVYGQGFNINGITHLRRFSIFTHGTIWLSLNWKSLIVTRGRRLRRD